MALGGGDKHLVAVGKAEERRQAIAVAHDRIEWIDDPQPRCRRGDVDDPRFDIRWCQQIPPLSVVRLQFDGDQISRRQGPDSYFLGIHRAPEALDFTERSKAQPVERIAAQPVDLIGVIMGRFAVMRRNHAFGEVVIFGEILAMGGRQFAGIPELVHHPFVRRAIPHLFCAFDFGVEGLGGQWSFCRDPGFDLVRVYLRNRLLKGNVTRYPFAQSPELALPHRVELDWQDRGIMGEMFEHRTVLAEQSVEHWFAIILVAAPQDMMMGAGDILDRVELDKAETADHLRQIERTGRRIGQRLRLQPEPAGLPVADPQRHRVQTAVVSIWATFRSRRVAR